MGHRNSSNNANDKHNQKPCFAKVYFEECNNFRIISWRPQLIKHDVDISVPKNTALHILNYSCLLVYIYEVSFLGEPQWQLQSSLSGWGNSIQVVGSLISQKQLFTSNHRPDIFVSNWKKCCYNKSHFCFTVFSYFGILLQQMFVPNVIFVCFKIFFCKAIW